MTDDELSQAERRELATTLDEATVDMANDVEYLLGLASEALRDEEHFESDADRAEWVVTQWCQELQWLPDLENYSPGETVLAGEQEARTDD